MMKFVALVAVVNAEADPVTPKPNGTACTFVSETDTFCGAVDSTCCGVAAGGTVVGSDPAVAGPNLVVCNSRTAAGALTPGTDFTSKDFTGVSVMYPGASFNCMAGAKALIASAAAAFTLASMI